MVSINERMGFAPVEVSDRVRQVPLTNRSCSPGRGLRRTATGRRGGRRRAPGSRRSAGGRPGSTTGCPPGGTWTAPSTIPSLGSSSLADPRRRLALEAEADPVGRRTHGVRRGAEPVERVGGEPVRARPGRDPQRARQRRPAACPAARAAPTAYRPGASCRPRRAADPPRPGCRSTASRARARRRHRPRPRRRTALPRSATRAGAGHRRAPTRPGRGRARRRPPRPASAPRSPPPRRRRRRSARARPRSPRAAPRRDRCRPAGWRASAAGRSSGPARGTPRCARPVRPRSWTVVSAPAPLDGQRHAGTNLTRVPGASRAGSLRSGSQRVRSVWPSSRQPPGDSDG